MAASRLVANSSASRLYAVLPDSLNTPGSLVLQLQPCAPATLSALLVEGAPPPPGIAEGGDGACVGACDVQEGPRGAAVRRLVAGLHTLLSTSTLCLQAQLEAGVPGWPEQTPPVCLPWSSAWPGATLPATEPAPGTAPGEPLTVTLPLPGVGHVEATLSPLSSDRQSVDVAAAALQVAREGCDDEGRRRDQGQPLPANSAKAGWVTLARAGLAVRVVAEGDAAATASGAREGDSLAPAVLRVRAWVKRAGRPVHDLYLSGAADEE